MERMGDLTRKGLRTPAAGVSRNTATHTRKGMSRSEINHLFETLAGMYGYKFTRQYGTTDEKDSWLLTLNGVTPEQIKQGLRKCVYRSQDNHRTGEKDYPPTAGEFRAMCVEEPPRALREFPQLEKQFIPAAPETMARHIEAMKRKLGMETNDGESSGDAGNGGAGPELPEGHG